MDRLFEQYKLAVEMWDRTRARRQLSNSFYATMNAALVAAISANNLITLISPYICSAGIGLCVLWVFNTYRYRRINKAKEHIVIRIETLFQFRPFSAEHQKVDNTLILLTVIESLIAFVFAAIYGFVLVFHKS
jgi:hypothetical protein